MMARTLRAQLSFTILLVLLIMVAFISIFSNVLINREFENYIMRQESNRSESIISDLENQYNPLTKRWDNNFLHTVGMYSLYDGYILKIYGADGSIQWDAENHDMSLCSRIMSEISERMDTARKKGEFITNAYNITQNGTTIGSVSITYYGPFFFTENDYLFIRTLNHILLAVGLLSFATAIVTGSVLARRIACPISKTAYIATQIAQGNYNIRFESTPETRELQEMMISINHLTEALSEQENLRKRLTTDIAHELRTPLSAISSHLEAMIEGIWEPSSERLRGCHEEIERLGHLVSELEHLAKIEDKNLKLNKAPVDLFEIGQTVVTNFKSHAMKKNISLTIQGSSVIVAADRERMLQVITNLLSNAINYTLEGGHIQVKTSNDNEIGSICVLDDGSGISENELPFIFERFYRTDKSRSRKTGGIGIGLAIAKSIVEAHGGTIRVESEWGKGSCFTVQLTIVK